MSLFEEIGDTFFGGAAKDAAREEQKGMEDASRSMQNALATAKGESQALYGGAMDSVQNTFQGALDQWDRIASRQADMVQQGNMGAQQQILSGLQQSHGNILGRPMDYGALQPQSVSHNFNMGMQIPDAMDPRNITDERGVPFDLQNLPYEANNIIGMLRDGNLTYQEAAEFLTTGGGYGSFHGLPRSTVNRLIADFLPGGSRYSEQTDLSKAGRDPYTNAQKAWKQYYG